MRDGGIINLSKLVSVFARRKLATTSLDLKHMKGGAYSNKRGRRGKYRIKKKKRGDFDVRIVAQPILNVNDRTQLM